METVAKYWIQEALALQVAMFGWIWRKVNKQKKEYDALKLGIRAQLRDRINQSCQYHLAHKEISNRDREVLKDMFDQYFAIGGNGTVGHQVGEIDALPTKVETFK